MGYISFARGMDPGIELVALALADGFYIPLNHQGSPTYTIGTFLQKEMATHSSTLAWKNPMDRGTS